MRYDPRGDFPNVVERHKRKRGTALVFIDGKVLLVRDKGKKAYSLPGGGIKKHERSVSAAARELKEELGMDSFDNERMPQFDFETKHTIHNVSLINSNGYPKITSRELTDFILWDMKEDIPRYDHVDHIIENYKFYMDNKVG